METFNIEGHQHVRLCFYQPEYDDTLQTFSLPEEQRKFTALPNEALALCLTDRNRHPVVILSGHAPVGFFVLHDGQDIRSFTNNPNAILLRALSINFIYQGKGYAQSAMRLLPGFVSENFSFVDEIVLAVNEGNTAAKHLYEKAGFRDKGIKIRGRAGAQYILHYAL